MPVNAWQPVCNIYGNTLPSLPTLPTFLLSMLSDKLNLVIDFENRSSKHLGRIADSMSEWEGRIADELDLTPADVAAIKAKYPNELKLQT